MDKDHTDDADLDALFDAVRADPPAVPDALMARVLADAAAVQKAPSLWSRISDALGGLPALGGLVTATCVGLWLGIAPPESMPDLAGQVMGFEVEVEDDFDAVGLMDFTWDIEEG